MVNGTATLVMDIGNSSTKAMVKFGNNKDGKPRTKMFELSNCFGNIETGMIDSYLRNETYKDDTSRIFVHNGDTYCNGEICMAEFGAVADRPTALEKKYESFISTLTVKNALCKAYECLADITQNDLDGIEVNWNFVVLLPPDDIEAGSKAMAELIKGVKSIEFLKPKLKTDISINKISIFPEGFAAFIAVLYEPAMTVRTGYEYLVADGVSTLVVDIGAGTTDFMLIRGKNVVNSTRFTREVGGNNVHQRLRRAMKQSGITLSDAAAREGCETGYIYSGAKKYDVIAQIAQAKRQVSRQLVDAIKEFFEDNMIPIQSINNILICGGGAEDSKVDGIEPISKYVFEFLQNVSKDIGLVELPMDENGERVSSRLLNIIGAGILAA